MCALVSEEMSVCKNMSLLWEMFDGTAQISGFTQLKGGPSYLVPICPETQQSF